MEPWLAPVYDAEGMASADRWTIEDAGVDSLDLMESAGRGLADATTEVAGDGPVRVLCGKGNNGGDGLVAARLLRQAGHQVEVILLWPAGELSPDAGANFARLGDVSVIEGQDGIKRLGDSGAVIDAMLGTGFSGWPRDPVKTAIEAVNAGSFPVIACDIPSGVDASTGEADLAVEADTTVTFHARKVGHLVNPGKVLCGTTDVVPIGIAADAPAGNAAAVITEAVLDRLPARGPRSTKFSSGRVSVVGGSKGLTGAVCLAADAAVRAGAGYATVAVPASLELIFEIKLTEVMSLGVGRDALWLQPGDTEAILEHCRSAAAVVLGSGMGRHDGVAELVGALTTGIRAPLVIDADGLSSLAGDPGAIKARSGPTLITPHAGEAARLLDLESHEINACRLDSARRLARETGAVVVLKGDDSIVTDGERVAVNDLSSPGLATAGTGDVLAGACGALLARGLDPFTAANAAVVGHARAGRLAAGRLGTADGVIASDVIEALPEGLSRQAGPGGVGEVE